MRPFSRLTKIGERIYLSSNNVKPLLGT